MQLNFTPFLIGESRRNWPLAEWCLTGCADILYCSGGKRKRKRTTMQRRVTFIPRYYNHYQNHTLFATNANRNGKEALLFLL